MSFFTSKRERRLWALTLAVVVAIYATLGLTWRVSKVLRSAGLIEGIFILGLLLIIAAIVIQALKTRPGGLEIGVGLGVLAVYLLVFARISLPEERTHLIEYGVVALLIYEALKERVSQGRYVPVPPLLAIVATGLIGLIDECIQAFLPNRVFDPLDIMFNVLAGVMAIVASLALAWARRLGPSSEN